MSGTSDSAQVRKAGNGREDAINQLVASLNTLETCGICRRWRRNWYCADCSQDLLKDGRTALHAIQRVKNDYHMLAEAVIESTQKPAILESRIAREMAEVKRLRACVAHRRKQLKELDNQLKAKIRAHRTRSDALEAAPFRTWNREQLETQLSFKENIMHRDKDDVELLHQTLAKVRRKLVIQLLSLLPVNPTSESESRIVRSIVDNNVRLGTQPTVVHATVLHYTAILLRLLTRYLGICIPFHISRRDLESPFYDDLSARGIESTLSYIDIDKVCGPGSVLPELELSRKQPIVTMDGNDDNHPSSGVNDWIPAHVTGDRRESFGLVADQINRGLCSLCAYENIRIPWVERHRTVPNLIRCRNAVTLGRNSIANIDYLKYGKSDEEQADKRELIYFSLDFTEFDAIDTEEWVALDLDEFERDV
eukprot:Clim_evm31s157 gene=Clim_evmTU31s157